MATPLPFPGGHSVVKPPARLCFLSVLLWPCLFSAGLGIARLFHAPYSSSLLKYSHSFLVLRTCARPFSHTNHSFPSSSVFPNLPFLPNLGRPLCAPSLPALPGFPQTFAPRELSLRYQRSWESHNSVPFLLPHPRILLLITFLPLSGESLQRRHFCFVATQPPANNLPPFSPLQITYLLFFHF